MRVGAVDDTRTVIGSDGLSIGCVDVIQTRRNESGARVANRQMWVVRSVREDGAVWATEPAAVSGRDQYGCTPQGLSVAESHTVVGDAMGAASAYVGMTRGRSSNRLHLAAADVDDARDQFALVTGRDRAERGPPNAAAAARESVEGLATSTSSLKTPSAGLSR